MKTTVKAIGGTVIRVGKFNGWRLDIMQPSDIDDGVYYPPTSITLYTECYIKALRDALTEALED
jgi:hypothetical protein